MVYNLENILVYLLPAEFKLNLHLHIDIVHQTIRVKIGKFTLSQYIFLSSWKLFLPKIPTTTTTKTTQNSPTTTTQSGTTKVTTSTATNVAINTTKESHVNRNSNQQDSNGKGLLIMYIRLK